MLLYNSQRNNVQSIRRAAARSASESLRHLTNDEQLLRRHNPHDKFIANFRPLAPGSLLALAHGPDPLPNNLPALARNGPQSNTAAPLVRRRGLARGRSLLRPDATRHIFCRNAFRIATRRDATLQTSRCDIYARGVATCRDLLDVCRLHFLTP